MDPASYETDEVLQQYLLFHYGEPEEQLPWKFGPEGATGFPERCVSEGVIHERLPDRSRALEVGCAVGRATFELGRIFSEVVGIDFSEVFVEAARRLDEAGSLSFNVRETGSITREAIACKPEGCTGAIRFEQGDAQALPEELGTFDAVLAANLLCRLQRPMEFLKRLPSLLNPGGQLVITTPNTWLESFTAREFWLGATPETGEPLEALKQALGNDFTLDATWDMPFLIREHRRKYQWSVAQATRWIRHA